MKFIKLTVFLLIVTACHNNKPVQKTIKEDVIYLSNDSLEGRQTGSKGELKAAKYIAQRFEDLGLQPKGTNGFFQEFSFKPKTSKTFNDESGIIIIAHLWRRPTRC